MSGLPPIDSALLPADVRKAGPKAEQAYESALSFESVLTEQLTQSLTPTLTGSATGDGSDDDDGTGDDTGSGSTDAATQLTAQMLPDALSQSLTAAGGLGLARQLYDALGGAKGDGGSA
jgi:Rod binding domain-containing protein